MPVRSLSVVAGGVALRLTSAAPEWERAVVNLAAELDPDPYPNRDRDGSPTITFGGRQPSPRRDAPTFTGLDVQGWLDAQGPDLQIGPARIQVQGMSHVRVTGRGADAQAVVHRAVPFALGWALAGRGAWLVHAAAVAQGPASGALLVLGPSGMGKSTVAAAALHAGWMVLGDDLVVLRWRAEGLEVQGVRRPLALPNDLGWAEAGRTDIGGDDRERWTLPRSRWDPGVGVWAPLQGPVLLTHGRDGTSQSQRLDPADVLSAVWTAHFPAAVRSGLGPWLRVATEIGRAPGWRLKLGADPGTRLHSTAQELQAIMDGCVFHRRDVNAPATTL